jgi:hypothetical protein
MIPVLSRVSGMDDTPSREPTARRVVVAEDEALIRLDLVEMLRDSW